MTLEAEVHVLWPQAKGCPQPAALEEPCPRASRRCGSSSTFVWPSDTDSGPSIAFRAWPGLGCVTALAPGVDHGRGLWQGSSGPLKVVITFLCKGTAPGGHGQKAGDRNREAGLQLVTGRGEPAPRPHSLPGCRTCPWCQCYTLRFRLRRRRVRPLPSPDLRHPTPPRG